MTLTKMQILTLTHCIAGCISADMELTSRQRVALRLDIAEAITDWNDYIASVPIAECLPHGGKCTACLSCQRLDGYDEAFEQGCYDADELNLHCPEDDCPF